MNATNTTITVSKEFNAFLESHGTYGDTKEAILIRLLGDKFKIPTGDRGTGMYDKKDVDSRKTKRSLKTGFSKEGKNGN
jgi:hypothetical protein